MKIAHVLFSLVYAGMETMAVNIANCQAEAGHDVSMIIINNIVDRQLRQRLDPRVRFVCLGRRLHSRNPWPIINMNIRLMRFDPDVIHIHDAPIIRLMLPPLRSRTCVTQHTVPVANQIPWLPRVPKRFAISNLVADDMHNRLGLDSTVILNGINTALIRTREPRTAPASPLRIIMIGRLNHEIKGQDILIEAMAMLRDRYGCADIHADIYGEGPSLEYLRSLAAERGLADAVTFKGVVTQEYLGEHIRDYDLFVHPARYEGFGLTVAEAMAANVPVLVSDSMGPYEVVDHGRCGYTFATGDADALAQAIARIKSAPDDPAMLGVARRRVLDLYDVTVTATRYLYAYPRRHKA